MFTNMNRKDLGVMFNLLALLTKLGLETARNVEVRLAGRPDLQEEIAHCQCNFCRGR